MQPSDKQLLLSCRDGDQSAWETLVNRYQRLIYTIPRRAGLDDDHAAEVFQDVFATLFQKLGEIAEPDRLHSWLVTTARRKTWRVIQKERGWQQMKAADSDTEDEMLEIPDNALPVDEVLVQLEEQHRVRTALENLDDRCRKLLKILFYAAEPTPYAEIAKQLGTSEGSIGPTRARCLAKMLRLLEN